MLNEANAIGTAALRGRMLPEPYRSTVAPLLKEYVTLRIRNNGDALDSLSTTEVLRRSLAIQESFWRASMDVAAGDSGLCHWDFLFRR